MNKGERTKKKIIEAMEKSLGVVTTACRMAGVSRSLYYKYYNSDPEFRKKCQEMEDVALDFSESALYQGIADGNMTGIIWHLKTKGKHRGWVERIETVQKVEDDLDELTDEELKERLEQVRKRNAKKADKK